MPCNCNASMFYRMQLGKLTCASVRHMLMRSLVSFPQSRKTFWQNRFRCSYHLQHHNTVHSIAQGFLENFNASSKAFSENTTLRSSAVWHCADDVVSTNFTPKTCQCTQKRTTPTKIKLFSAVSLWEGCGVLQEHSTGRVSGPVKIQMIWGFLLLLFFFVFVFVFCFFLVHLWLRDLDFMSTLITCLPLEQTKKPKTNCQANDFTFQLHVYTENRRE